MHFLQKKIELLAEFARAVQQFPKLLQVATQAIQFFADVAALGQDRGFLREARRINRRAAEQIFQTTFQAAGKRWTQSRGVCVDLLGKFVESREAPAQIVYKVAPLGAPHFVQLSERLQKTPIQSAAKLLLLLFIFWNGWSQAPDNTRQAQQCDNIQSSRDGSLQAQLIRSLQ